jgi:hypothetical protein
VDPTAWGATAHQIAKHPVNAARNAAFASGTAVALIRIMLKPFSHLTAILCLGMLPVCLGCSEDATTPALGGEAVVPQEPATTKPAPGEPMVGRFVRSTVQGLAYETASGSGTTDEDGAFNYLQGEEVTFRIGGLVVGSAPAKPEITPFDLAGATARQICDEFAFHGAMVEPKMRTALNIETLFHALDDDGNAGNGIRIAEEVAALFGSDPLDFDLGANRFDNERPLRTALAQANEQALFPTHRIVPKPTAVAEHLFDFSSSCDQVSSASGAKFNPNWATSFIRNADARVVEARGNGVLFQTSEFDANGDLLVRTDLGPLGEVYRRDLYTYDDNRLLLRHENQSSDGVLFWSQEHTYDQDGNRTITRNVGVAFDGGDAYDDLVTSTFDAFGNLLQVTVEKTTTDKDDNTWVEPTSIRQYEYDSHNDLIRYDRDGLVTLLQYGGEHQLVWMQEDQSGQSPRVHTIERDAGGRAVRHELVTWAATYVSLNEYDDAGRVLRHEQHQDGELKSFYTRTYDDQDRLIEADYGYMKQVWTFDDVNLIERMETIYNSSKPTETVTTQRDPETNTEHVEVDENDDGVVDASWTVGLDSTGVGVRFQDVPNVPTPGKWVD